MSQKRFSKYQNKESKNDKVKASQKINTIECFMLNPEEELFMEQNLS